MSEPFSELLRRAILEAGETRYSICCRTGVDQATLSKFVRGKITLNLATIDKLVDGLDIKVKLPNRGN